MDFDQATPGNSSSVPKFFSNLSRRYQSFLDAWTPHTASRWIFAAFLFIAYMVRVILLQGWYIITYALGIYYLNLFIAFLTPMINPSVQEDMADEDGPTLPTSSSDEFRPFIRRLPEFKFWHNFTKATMIAFSLTFFEVFNIPVFWPILLLYFITLMFITLKRQIMHMIKYGYVPWTRNKTRYAGREDTGRVVYSQ